MIPDSFTTACCLVVDHDFADPVGCDDRYGWGWLLTTFPEPNAFDIDRESDQHLTFGSGRNRCGEHLAVTEMLTAPEEILAGIPDHSLVEPTLSRTEWRGSSSSTRVPATLDVTFAPVPR